MDIEAPRTSPRSDSHLAQLEPCTMGRCTFGKHAAVELDLLGLPAALRLPISDSPRKLRTLLSTTDPQRVELSHARIQSGIRLLELGDLSAELGSLLGGADAIVASVQ